jgi:hypothetical protein
MLRQKDKRGNEIYKLSFSELCFLFLVGSLKTTHFLKRKYYGNKYTHRDRSGFN